MIKCALIGYGYWGPKIAQSLVRIPDVKLEVICEADEAKIISAKTNFPYIEISNSFKKTIKRSDIDAVILATPAITHLKLGLQILNAGKHVFIEKPLTTTSKDGKKLKQAAIANNKQIMVGHVYEFNPSIHKIKQMIDDDELGKVYYLYSARLNLGQVRGDINALWNLAPHDISIANLLLGSQPIEVSAHGLTFLQKGFEDIAFMLLRYPNNIHVHIHVSWLDPSKVRNLIVVGSKKMVIFDDLETDAPIKIYDKRADLEKVAENLQSTFKVKLHSGDIFIPQIKNTEPLKDELADFFRSLQANETPKIDVDNGINVVKVLEAAQKSLKKDGKWIKIK